MIRHVMYQSMKIMGHQFVLGQKMHEALKNGKKYCERGYSYSFDMLGESSLTMADAKAYVDSYMHSIATIGSAPQFSSLTGAQRPTMSIKLSAMHPRYDVANRDRVLTEMHDMFLGLLKQARKYDVGLTIDAEEMDRLELSLELFEKLYRNPVVRGWGLFGLVVQTYSKRALPVLVWLAALAKEVRITSYNVCYTKLLRIVAAGEGTGKFHIAEAADPGTQVAVKAFLGVDGFHVDHTAKRSEVLDVIRPFDDLDRNNFV